MRRPTGHLGVVSLAGALVALGVFPACAAHQRDQGITSETHRTYNGGMVFASADIPKGTENPATFKDAFTLGDPIYGRFYLKTSLDNEARDRGWSTYGTVIGVTYGFVLRVSVDGAVVGEHAGRMDPGWTTYKLALVRSGGDSFPWGETRWFLDKIAPTLTAGDHVVALSVVPVPKGKRAAEGAPVATGSFKLTVPADVKKAIAKIASRETSAERFQGNRAASAATAAPAEGPADEAPAPESPVEACIPDGAECGSNGKDCSKCCGQDSTFTKTVGHIICCAHGSCPAE